MAPLRKLEYLIINKTSKIEANESMSRSKMVGIEKIKELSKNQKPLQSELSNANNVIPKLNYNNPLEEQPKLLLNKGN